MKKNLKILIIFLSILLFFTSCSRNNFSYNNLENKSKTTDSFVTDTIYNEITEDFTNEDTINIITTTGNLVTDIINNEIAEKLTSKDAINVHTTELNVDNNEWESNFQYLIPLKKYLIKLKDDDVLLLYYPNLVIHLFDYNHDGNSDALVSEGALNGTLYYLINNINDPQFIYSFSSFDNANLLYNLKESQLIIKYIKNYGLNTYATSETNFIYLGNKINEIKHVHFSGTSKPEEFYIELQGEKIICTEEELHNSISEIEQNLEPFSDFEKFKMTIIDDEITIIGLD